jgi:hypothetical protein
MTGQTYLSGLLILLCSISVFGQKKKAKSADSEEGSVFVQAEGISISQTGRDNNIIIDQTPDSTHITANGETQVFSSGSNKTVFHRPFPLDSSAPRTNTAIVSQSGNGNRAIIRQAGSSNSVSVSQGPPRKKED